MREGSILMIAYHVPPCAEVSGAIRTLAFTRYLSEAGLQPAILAPSMRAYPAIEDMSPVPCEITRAFALDAKRHFGVGGRFPQLLALPDRWVSWWPAAVVKGLKWIERHRPLAIWSTYPIATAHLIAYTLHHRTGIPWIADFRDPVAAPAGQEYTLTARSRAWVERLTLGSANACVFVTPGAREWYARHYDESAEKLVVIPNGYDEEAFAGLSRARRSDDGRFTLVHSGVLYLEGRNPEPFFAALARLLRNAQLDARKLRVVLRGCRSEVHYRPMLLHYGLEGVVELAPPVSRDEALREQSAADALLLFQGHKFNRQIPAKVYEYFRVGRPILAVADLAGETARLVAETGAGRVLPIDNSEALAAGIPKFIAEVARGGFEPMTANVLDGYSRRSGAAKLQTLIKRLTSSA